MNKLHPSSSSFASLVFWALLIGVGGTGILESYRHITAAPVPYSNVEILSVTEAPKVGYLVEAVFTKNECTFKRLEVFGNNTGVLTYLKWQPKDGSPSKNYDRSKGQQYLLIEVTTVPNSYDTIEIRTRHDCNGVIVDKVFAIIDLNKADK